MMPRSHHRCICGHPRSASLAGLIGWALVALGLTATEPDPHNPVWVGQTMGSFYTVKLAGFDGATLELEKLKVEVDQALVEVNRQMSHYQTNSELSAFNQSQTTAPFKVSADFATVCRFALQLSRTSDGAFDPTLGPLINLWGFGKAGEKRKTPPESEIQRLRQLVGFHHLTATPDGALLKDLPQLQLNLSGITKGFGVDCMARVLHAHGHSNFLVQISGETYASGRNPQGRPWRIGIDTPEPGHLPGERMEAVVALSNRALSTSGDYRKFFVDEQGRRQCHILDPKTGRPVQHVLASVTVLAENTMTADAFTKPLFVLGTDRGLKWIEARTNAAALFIERRPDGTFKIIPSSRFPAYQTQP